MTKNMKYGIKVGTIIITVLVGATVFYFPLGVALMALFGTWFWLHTPSVTADTIDNDLKASSMEIEAEFDKHPIIDLGYQGGDKFRLVTEGEAAAAGKAAAEHLSKAFSKPSEEPSEEPSELEDAARPSIP